MTVKRRSRPVEPEELLDILDRSDVIEAYRTSGKLVLIINVGDSRDSIMIPIKPSHRISFEAALQYPAELGVRRCTFATDKIRVQDIIDLIKKKGKKK